MTKLNYIEINPEKKQPLGSIIWLHGLGADGHDFVPMTRELNLPHDLPIRFIFPHAPLRPVTLNNGYVMRAWFDIYEISRTAKIDEAGINQSVQGINELIAQEEKRGISSDRIVVGGFSQGAVIAINTGLTYSKRLTGIVALSGYLPNPNTLLAKAHANNKATPIFMAHGTQDMVIPDFLGKEGYHFLRDHQFNVSWHSYSMGHSVCEPEIKDISQWFQSNIYPIPTE